MCEIIIRCKFCKLGCFKWQLITNYFLWQSMTSRLLLHKVHNIMYAFKKYSIDLKIPTQVICCNRVVLFSERKDVRTHFLPGRDGELCNSKFFFCRIFIRLTHFTFCNELLDILGQTWIEYCFPCSPNASINLI